MDRGLAGVDEVRVPFVIGEFLEEGGRVVGVRGLVAFLLAKGFLLRAGEDTGVGDGAAGCGHDVK